MLLDMLVFASLTAGALKNSALIIAVCIFMRFFCERRVTAASYKAGADVKRVLRERIYEKLLRLGAAYKESISTAEIVQMAAEGVEQLEVYFGKYLAQLFYSIAAPLTLFIVLSFVNLKASAVLLVCVPLIPVSIIIVQKIAKRLLSKYWDSYIRLGDSFLENLQGLTTLKVYEADAAKADEMDAESQNFRKITMKVLTMQLNSTSVMDIIAYGGAAVGMGVAIREFIGGNLGFGGCLMVILLASEFFLPLRFLGSFFHIAMNGMAASDKIFALLDLPEDVPGGEAEMKAEPVDIDIRNLDFAYEKERPILNNISMSFKAASLTSIVGESGCGKSTVAGIITGRNKGYEGNIDLNGSALSDFSEKSRMRGITLVTHESYIFKGSFAQNLKMGKASATDTEMQEALLKVNLLDFVNSRGGLYGTVSERGSDLSGGQRQRLALARALLHDSQVYIFDEATSNIDAESEAMIMAVIHELARTRTVILISHRLANVVDSDNIYMLSGGYICEAGNHEALMAANGSYAKLYKAQYELEHYAKSGREAAV